MNTPKTTSVEENVDNQFIDQSSQTFPRTILVSSFIVISTIIILWWTKRRQRRLRRRGGSLLLCGLSNSGKTLLFNRLSSGVQKQIVDSKRTNHGTMTLDYLSTDRPIKNVHVIDIFDSGCRRQQNLHAYKTSAKAIIFVIDSTTIEKDIKQISDYLYDILREKYFRDQHLPLLIFCNKQDLAEKNQNAQSIRHLLEDELSMKRTTSASSINLHQKNHKMDNDIGRPGKETFEFSDMKDIQIEFVEGSVLATKKKLNSDKHKDDEEVIENSSHLLKVHEWIARIWFK